jgi:hypothetical protein
MSAPSQLEFSVDLDCPCRARRVRVSEAVGAPVESNAGPKSSYRVGGGKLRKPAALQPLTIPWTGFFCKLETFDIIQRKAISAIRVMRCTHGSSGPDIKGISYTSLGHHNFEDLNQERTQ